MNPFKNSIIILFAVALITFFSFKLLNQEESNLQQEKNISIKRLETAPEPKPISLPQTKPTTIPAPAQTSNSQLPAQQTPSQLTLSTKVNYGVPGGTQSLSVQVTLQNNVVVGVTTTHSMKGDSKKYQQNFENNYKSSVIGKNIKTLNLSRVSGASLTTNAFYQAISSIRNSL